jgi:DMSO/TMAO reductase YedYZ molybdopterin-dependent catalytic subunit
MTFLSRRRFLSVGVVAASGRGLLDRAVPGAEPAPKKPARPLLYTGGGPARGKPSPHSLKGEALVKARLTPESWRLEIVADGGARLGKPRKLDDGTAIDLAALLELGKKHGVKFIKAMQCRSGCYPQDQALWEGVPLREVLKLAGTFEHVMRVYANGFHNNDPRQLFQSSASYTQVMDSAPGDLPVMVAYRHNGEPIPVNRGGPVRLILPWAYGFKNIKWLQRLRLTSDTKVIDTYGGEPDAYLKTQAPRIDGPEKLKAGVATTYRGVAVVGLPGLKRVEYWLRAGAGKDGKLGADDPVWQGASWQPCNLEPPPDDWSAHLPRGISSKELWGFDPQSGQPKEWPLRYTVAFWTLTLKVPKSGNYQLRARTVDLNGFAQPQPRPQQTGSTAIPCKVLEVSD